MQPGSGTVGDIDQPPVIEVHVIRLDHSFYPRFGFFGRIRNEKSHLSGVKRIGDVYDSQPRVEISDIEKVSSDDFPILCLGKLMRAETASSLAEISIWNLEGRDGDGTALFGYINNEELSSQLLAAAAKRFSEITRKSRTSPIPFVKLGTFIFENGTVV